MQNNMTEHDIDYAAGLHGFIVDGKKLKSLVLMGSTNQTDTS